MQIDDIAFLPLNQEGKFAIVDAEDLRSLSRYRWCFSNGYAMRGRRVADPQGASLYALHQSVLRCPPGTVVDHINRVRVDNRKQNLRCATKAQNAANSGMKSNNTSGYRGVFWDKRRRKWSARIWSEGKLKWLGDFVNPEDAARTYDAVFVRLHGVFAQTNFHDES